MSFYASGSNEPPRNGPGFFASTAIIVAGFVGAMLLLLSGFMGPTLQHMGFMLALLFASPFIIGFLWGMRKRKS